MLAGRSSHDSLQTVSTWVEGEALTVSVSTATNANACVELFLLAFTLLAWIDDLTDGVEG